MPACMFAAFLFSIGDTRAQIKWPQAVAFEELEIPVITVNGDLWPIDYEANRRHMTSFEAIVVKDADHFLMINRHGEFNNALARAIQSIVEKRAKQ